MGAPIVARSIGASMTIDVIEGGCLCAAIRYRITGAPLAASPASVTAISWHPGGPVVLAVNSTGRPLTELQPS